MGHTDTPEPGAGEGRDGTRNVQSGSAESALQFRDNSGVINIGTSEIGPPQEIPWQVPAAPAHFVNREPELERVSSVLGRTGGTNVLILEGARGIGKSAFIRQGSALLRERFPGGQLYFEYPRTEAAARRADPDTAVTDFLRSLGVQIDHLKTYRQRVAAFHSRSRGATMLVVVEGAEEAAQVRPLIPTGPGSAILVTSDGPSLAELELAEEAWSVTLEPLTPDSGRALLRELAGDAIGSGEQDAVDRLVAACEGLPLALVIVAARLRRRQGAGVAVLASELEDEKRRLTGMGIDDRVTLSAAFGVSYQRLSAPAAELYRALGAWPGRHFDAGVAAAAAGLDGPVVRPLLRELADANLVEPVHERGDGHFRFRHSLIGLDARDRSAGEDSEAWREACLMRALDHYLVVLAFADRAAMGTRTRAVDVAALTADMVDPFGGDKPRALRYLDHERSTLVAVVRAAARAELHDHAWQLAEMATALYLSVRYVADWVETGSLGADSARIAGNQRAEARLRSLVSRPLTDLDKLGRAGEQLDRALDIAGEVDDLMLRASVHEFHGRYLDYVEPDRAIAAYNRAQELSERFAEAAQTTEERLNGLRGAALPSYYRGCAHDAANRHDVAVTELREALRRFLGLPRPDRRMAARARASLGRAYFRAGRLEDASRELNEAVRALQAEGQPYYEAEARETFASVLTTLGLAAEARPHLERALETYRAGGSPRAEEVRGRITKLGD